jgi:DNA mismatch repair protein MutL
VPVFEETELLKVDGFVAKPSFAKRTRGEQFFFVNNRFIKNSYLHHAVSQSFEGLLKPKTHPSYFINFTIDPKTIDINIHPTKTEIKFEDEYSIYTILRSTVKHSLGQFNIAPVLDFDRDKTMDPDYKSFQTNAKMPKVEVDRNFNPFKDNSSTKQEINTKTGVVWQELYPKETKAVFNQPEIGFEALYDSKSLFNESIDLIKSFQFLNKYIVSSRAEGIVIINQNRAHQRVLYEQFLKQITQEAASSQQLMFPLVLELSKEEVVLLNTLKESMELTGFMFDFSKAEQGSVLINGIPNILIESQIEGVLLELLADFKNDVPASGFDRNNRLSIVMSKNMAIPNGKVLKEDEQTDLIKALYSCKEPLLSPENRPIFVELNDKLIEKLFHT